MLYFLCDLVHWIWLKQLQSGHDESKLLMANEMLVKQWILSILHVAKFAGIYTVDWICFWRTKVRSDFDVAVFINKFCDINFVLLQSRLPNKSLTFIRIYLDWDVILCGVFALLSLTAFSRINQMLYPVLPFINGMDVNSSMRVMCEFNEII